MPSCLGGRSEKSRQRTSWRLVFPSRVPRKLISRRRFIWQRGERRITRAETVVTVAGQLLPELRAASSVLEEHAVLSQPPPLPSTSVSSAPWRMSSPAAGSGRSSWINWSAIVSAVSLSFALVVGVLAWIVTHPHKAAIHVESPSVAAPETDRKSLPHAIIDPAVKLPSLHSAPEGEIIPAVYRSEQPERIARRIPLIEEAPPSLPPPALPEPKGEPGPAAAPAAPPQPAGETYGTQVLFLNNQEAAADLAKREHKLLFVMHISGNFEDSCFT